MPRAERLPPDRDLVRDLLAWFAANRRDLPWRAGDPGTGRRDAYRVLVSEVMLQQTQVSRVVEKFGSFLGRFPDAAALARAREEDVLAAWTGLGYYRRARSLHAAARALVERGSLPASAHEWRELPGVGRYTAGAVASLALGQAEPVVDGNVSRVLLRLHGKALASDDKGAVSWTWERAGDLVREAARGEPGVLNPPGAWNEALMELGATVCGPKSPRCEECPWRGACVARAQGQQGEIPKPKARARQRTLRHLSVLVADEAGRVLVERREGVSLWRGLFQVPTLEIPGDDERPSTSALLARLGLPKLGLEPLAEFSFQTTAARIDVRSWVASGVKPRATRALCVGGREWLEEGGLAERAFSSPQRRIIRAWRERP